MGFLEGALRAITGVGILTGGLGYLAYQFRRGKATANRDIMEVTNETMELLQKQVMSLQTMTEENKKEIAKQREEINQLKDQLDEKDKKINEYLQILQGRDPILRDVMQKIYIEIQDQHELSGKQMVLLRDIQRCIQQLVQPNLSPTV